MQVYGLAPRSSMNGNNVVTQITAANTWTKVSGTTIFSPSGGYQFVTGGINNRLVYTGPSMKMFHIACTLSVKGSESDNGTMKAVLFKNGVALTNGIVQQRLSGDGDIASTAIHVMTNMNTNDYLELWILNVTNTGDFTITEMNMFAMGISMGMD
jgi:hypothetical protein